MPAPTDARIPTFGVLANDDPVEFAVLHDLAFVRSPEHADKRIEFPPLFHETAVVAVQSQHRPAGRTRLSIKRARLSIKLLVDQPLIVPDRSSRPHSHDLTIKLFEKAGLRPTIAQVAEEKQTIINLVAAELGLAIVPRWTSRFAVAGVRFVPLDPRETGELKILPMAAAWLRETRDPVRDDMLTVLRTRLSNYTVDA